MDILKKPIPYYWCMENVSVMETNRITNPTKVTPKKREYKVNLKYGRDNN
jgi:hypothetical protein